jgi:hypothetical protein
MCKNPLQIFIIKKKEGEKKLRKQTNKQRKQAKQNKQTNKQTEIK